VNRSNVTACRSRVSTARLPRRHNRARLVAVRNSQDKVFWRRATSDLGDRAISNSRCRPGIGVDAVTLAAMGSHVVAGEPTLRLRGWIKMFGGLLQRDCAKPFGIVLA
jgi:hypothetical protein